MSHSPLLDRLRQLLAAEPALGEVAMFGGRSLMVNGKMLVHVRKNDDLLVRVDPARHDELTQLPGASSAEMGAGRVMGPGWIAVSAEAIASDEQLDVWLTAAREYNWAVAAD